MFWETDTLPQTVRGRDAARQTMQMYLSAFPLGGAVSLNRSRGFGMRARDRKEEGRT
jgi:hypothetical protein